MTTKLSDDFRKKMEPIYDALRAQAVAQLENRLAAAFKGAKPWALHSAANVAVMDYRGRVAEHVENFDFDKKDILWHILAGLFNQDGVRGELAAAAAQRLLGRSAEAKAAIAEATSGGDSRESAERLATLVVGTAPTKRG